MKDPRLSITIYHNPSQYNFERYKKELLIRPTAFPTCQLYNIQSSLLKRNCSHIIAGGPKYNID